MNNNYWSLIGSLVDMIAVVAFYRLPHFFVEHKMEWKAGFSSAIHLLLFFTLTTNCKWLLCCVLQWSLWNSFNYRRECVERKKNRYKHSHILMFRSIILYAVKYFVFRILCNNNKSKNYKLHVSSIGLPVSHTDRQTDRHTDRQTVNQSMCTVRSQILFSLL